jgi:DNA-binding transcriptional LysR family regulator
MSSDSASPAPDRPVSAGQVRRDVLRSISLDLNLLRVFIRVIDTGSPSAAAASLGCTPSDVHRRLTDFERELGASLLTHAPGGACPTTCGSTLLPYLRVVLATVDAIRRQEPPEQPQE